MTDNSARSRVADTPEPPYYAVIFSSLQSEDTEGYTGMAQAMETLARSQPGYLGIESAREGVGITVSYWASLDAIKKWKSEIAHLQAQRLGQDKWYDHYKVRIARVERDYGFGNGFAEGPGSGSGDDPG